jgi:cardiolipin synthase
MAACLPAQMGRFISCAAILFPICCVVGCSIERPVDYRIASKFTVDDPQFARTVSDLLGPSLVPGNHAVTLLNGDQSFPAMLEAIHSATKSVTFEMYVFWAGKTADEFIDAFAERARAGVKVDVLIDAVGGDNVTSTMIRRMTDAGVVVRRYHPFNPLDPVSWAQLDHRTHRKILVVDGLVGFTGGVGVADEWRGHAESPKHWRDTHYRITGPVVGQLQAAFAENWRKASGIVIEGNDYFPPLPRDGQQWAQICKSSIQGGSENMQLMFLLSIACAGKSVRIENSYFVPDQQTRQALIKAQKRGVSVEILVPGSKIDEKMVRQASRATWGELLKEGVAIYEYQPTMIHCKLLIVDERWVSIGSANIDNRSFRINDEANLNVLDNNFASEQTAIFEEDKKHARQITYEQWRHRPIGEKINNFLASIFSWEL